MDLQLTNKTALVTGASQGIGRATAVAFAAQGARVIATDINAQALATLQDDIGCTVHTLDVTDPLAIAAVAQSAGPIQVLFNGAGFVHAGSVLDCTEDEWASAFELNVRSQFRTIKAFLPGMLAQGGGSIINTASFVAVMGSATSQISYTASKGGVLAMSRELGVQFARQGIRVNALCPGPVNTPLLQELFAKDPERAQRRLVHIPIGRFAKPEELAAAVAFLGSDDSSFITGSTFLVDGGISGAYVTPD